MKIKMTLKNKLYNFIHNIKPLRRKGCFNCGIYNGYIVKFNWSIPNFRFTTKKTIMKKPKITKEWVETYKKLIVGENISDKQKHCNRIWNDKKV